MKIFIIDDECLIRDFIAEYFNIEGHTIITASSVKGAKAIIERETFDVAFVDFWMPDGRGTEIVRLIKTKRPAAKIIGMSGRDQGNSFCTAGADSFIRNPFDTEQILELIKETPQQRQGY